MCSAFISVGFSPVAWCLCLVSLTSSLCKHWGLDGKMGPQFGIPWRLAAVQVPSVLCFTIEQLISKR